MSESYSVEAVLKANISNFERNIGRAKSKMDGFVKGNQQTFDAFKQVGKAATVAGVAIAASLAGTVKLASDYQSAFAGVRKTVDATEAEFSKLSKGIRDMSKELPASATEIANVAEVAGQLGIKKQDILKFTRTMVDLGVATNMSSEEAATSLARLANITQMPMENIDRLGSTVVALGNNLATTEGEIVAMSLRLAGTGAQVGMTEAQITALAGAMSSVGIEAEAGGTAMSLVMTKINTAVKNGGKGLQGFAKVAGMSAQDFKATWERNPIEALDTFIVSLGKTGKAGGNLAEILGDLGIKGIRERDTLLRLSGASDVLTESVGLAEKAWKDNNALTKEAEERYKTFESKLKIFTNVLKDIGITIGNALLPYLTRFVDKATELGKKIGNINPKILAIGATAAAAAAGILLILGPIMLFVGMIPSFILGIKAIGTVLAALTGPVGIAIAAVTAIIAIGVAWYKNFEKIEEKLGTVGTVLLGMISPATAFATSVKLIKRSFEDSIQPIDRFAEGVTEATQKALGGFFELSDGVSATLADMTINSRVLTQEMANGLIQQYSEMNAEILAGMRERHKTELNELKNLFLNSSALTDTREQEILAKKQAANQAKEVSQQAHEDRIKEILQTAVEEKRALTQSEQEQINAIQQTMNQNAVQYLTDNERDQKVILERMKTDASELSALQAAEVTKNSASARDKVIADAEKKYNDVYAFAIKERDETGTISAEEADAIIQEAKKKRDESIKHARDMHSGVVTEARKQAGEHVNQVNWSTGEIKSKFQVMREDIGRKMLHITNDTRRGFTAVHTAAKSKMDQLKTTASSSFNAMKSTISQRMSQAVSTVKQKASEMPGKIREIASNMMSAGRDIVSGLISGIGQMFGGVRRKIESLANLIPSWAKKILGIKSPSRVFMAIGKFVGSGLIKGLTGTAEQVKSASAKLAEKVTDGFNANKAKIAKNNAAMASVTNTIKEQQRHIANLQKQRSKLGKKRSKVSIDKQIVTANKRINAANKKMSSLISENKALAKENSKLLAAKNVVNAQSKALQAIAKKREAVAVKLKDAKKKLEDAIKLRADFAKSVRDDVMSFGSVMNSKGTTGDGILKDMQDRLKKAKEFAANILKLRKMGLNNDTLEEIVAAGVEAGGAKAAVLANASKGVISQINSTQKQITATATSLGNTTAQQFYGVGVDAARGMVKGIESQIKALDKAAEKMANSVVKSTRKKLGIKSPSRVLETVGIYVGEGLMVGMQAMYRQVQRVSEGLAASVSTDAPAYDFAGQANALSRQANYRMQNELTANLNVGRQPIIVNVYDNKEAVRAYVNENNAVEAHIRRF